MTATRHPDSSIKKCQTGTQLYTTSYDGYIGNIRIRWTKPARYRLTKVFGESGGLLKTMKAIVENFVHATTARVGNTQAVIIQLRNKS